MVLLQLPLTTGTGGDDAHAVDALHVRPFPGIRVTTHWSPIYTYFFSGLGIWGRLGLSTFGLDLWAVQLEVGDHQAVSDLY
jgi:hypothetical protein